MYSKQQFFATVDAFMNTEMHRLFDETPSAKHLANDKEELNEKYYVRHRIETIKRIWMTSKTDALALSAMVDEDYESARWWSKYIYQELNHDLLYENDLKKHGISIVEIAKTPVYPATISMVDYIRRSIINTGSIAAVAYSVWVEWNSDKTSGIVVQRAQEKFSPKHVKGAKAHVGIDINEDHYSIMINIVHNLIQRSGGDASDFFHILRNITDFVALYFKELEEDFTLNR